MAPVPLETIRGWFETACCPTGLAPVSLKTMRGWFVVLGMMVSRSAEITGCIGCNACES